MRLIPIDDPDEPVIKSEYHTTTTKLGIFTAYFPENPGSPQFYELLQRHNGTQQWYRLDFDKL